jgi:hypothetical protein
MKHDLNCFCKNKTENLDYSYYRKRLAENRAGTSRFRITINQAFNYKSSKSESRRNDLKHIQLEVKSRITIQNSSADNYLTAEGIELKKPIPKRC